MCLTSSKGSESLGNVPKLDNGIMTEIASPILTPTFKWVCIQYFYNYSSAFKIQPSFMVENR